DQKTDQGPEQPVRHGRFLSCAASTKRRHPVSARPDALTEKRLSAGKIEDHSISLFGRSKHALRKNGKKSAIDPPGALESATVTPPGPAGVFSPAARRLGILPAAPERFALRPFLTSPFGGTDHDRTLHAARVPAGLHDRRPAGRGRLLLARRPAAGVGGGGP